MPALMSRRLFLKGASVASGLTVAAVRAPRAKTVRLTGRSADTSAGRGTLKLSGSGWWSVWPTVW